MEVVMGISIDYKKEILNLTKALPEEKLAELADFAQFLKSRTEGFSYMQVREDSVEYVKRLRKKEAKKARTSKKFIDEIIKWQKSGS
ncbi:MAG: hypothetical protein AABZ10_03050 [Nitrospirota bacterium]